MLLHGVVARQMQHALAFSEGFEAPARERHPVLGERGAQGRPVRGQVVEAGAERPGPGAELHLAPGFAAERAASGKGAVSPQRLQRPIYARGLDRPQRIDQVVHHPFEFDSDKGGRRPGLETDAADVLAGVPHRQALSHRSPPEVSPGTAPYARSVPPGTLSASTDRHHRDQLCPTQPTAIAPKFELRTRSPTSAGFFRKLAARGPREVADGVGRWLSIFNPQPIDRGDGWVGGQAKPPERRTAAHPAARAAEPSHSEHPMAVHLAPPTAHGTRPPVALAGIGLRSATSESAAQCWSAEGLTSSADGF